MKGNNSISTRNIGQFLYTAFSIITILVIGNSQSQQTLLSTFALLSSFFIVFSLIWQSSQRYSQSFVVFTILLTLLYPKLAYPFICLSLISILLLVNIKYTNFFGFAKSHFWNRVHDNDWSTKYYGFWRYGFINKLTGTTFKDFLSDALTFSYIKKMYSSPYYKHNIFSIFAVHRIYVYGFLCFLTYKFGLYSSSVLLVFLSAVVPSFLCLFRPFQGYGSSEVYVWANLPTAFLSVSLLISREELNEQSILAQFLVYIFCIECAAMLLSFSFAKILFLINRLRFNGTTERLHSDLVNVYRPSGIEIDITKLFCFVASNSNKFQYPKPALLLWCHAHLITTVEAMSKFLKKSNGDLIFQNALPMVDTPSYGLRNDTRGDRLVEPNAIFQVKPDFMVFDMTRHQSVQLYNYKLFKNINQTIIFRSNKILLVHLKWKV